MLPDGQGPVVLVTDAGRGSALAIIRSLGRKGWRVIAADADPRSPGFYSRYCWRRLVYPSPVDDPTALVNTLLSTVKAEGVDLLIPVTDEIIHPVSEVRQEFEALCHLAMADSEALARVTSKERTRQLARELGVPVPGTCTVRTVAEAREAAEKLSWPIVLKPEVSRQYVPEADTVEAFTVTYVNSMRDLEDQMARWAGRCAVLMQAYCPGVGQGIEMLAYQGRPLAAFQHVRLAEVPLTGGASAWRKSASLNPVLYDYAARLVSALSWTGLIMVEFKVDENSAVPGIWLMEINGRVWGSLPLAVLSGMDFPGRLADLYLQGPPEDPGPAQAYQIGLHAVNLDLMLVWLGQVLLGRQRYPFLPIPSRRRIVPALLGLLNPRHKFDVLSWHDPRPTVALLGKIGRKFYRKGILANR